MLRIILLLTYVILFTCACNSKKEVGTSKNLKLNNLLNSISTVNPDDNKRLIKDVLNFIKYESDFHDSSLVKAYFEVGDFYYKIGKIDTSSIYFQKAISYINDPIESQAQVKVFQRTFRAYKSLGSYEECAAIFTKFRSLINLNKNDRNSAIYYTFKEEYFKRDPYKYIDSILKYNQLAIERLRFTDDNNKINNLLTSRATFISLYLNDYKRSSEIFDELIVREKELSKATKILLFGNYGIQKYNQKQYKEAIVFYKRGIQLIDESIYKRDRLASGYGNIAEAYLQINDFENANSYLDSMRINVEEGVEERYLFFLRNLELEYEFKKEKSISKSLTSIKKYASELRSIHTKKYKNDLITLEQTLESRKEVLEESNRLKLESIKQKWNILILGLLLIGASLFGYLFYRNKTMKFELKQLLLHQRLLRSQMNPHFTYNFLFHIQSLIKNNQEKATSYLLKYSRLLRLILDNSTQNYVELSTELDILSNYIKLQSLRFPKGLSLDVMFEDMSKDDLIFIPPMILQPVLENCLEHGFININYEGEIKIRFKKDSKYIQCEIEDNGSGLDLNKDPKKDGRKGKSSTQLISEFLEKVTKTKLKLINKTGGLKGTIVRFNLPYKNSNFD